MNPVERIPTGLRAAILCSVCTYHRVVGEAYTFSGTVSIFTAIVRLDGHFEAYALMTPLLGDHCKRKGNGRR